jgi:RNase P subunit RPR2
MEGKDTSYKFLQKIDYVIGSGHHTNSHIFSINGYLNQMPYTFYTQERRADLPPGYENQQKFMCDQCTNVFFNEWSLKLHIKAKHTGAPVKPVKVVCPECDQEFNATMYFVQHYKYVHGGIPPGFEDKEKFMCDQCPSVFFNNLSLKLHYKTKRSDIIKDPAKVGRRNCPHCEKTFATYLSYKEHIKSKH